MKTIKARLQWTETAEYEADVTFEVPDDMNEEEFKRQALDEGDIDWFPNVNEQCSTPCLCGSLMTLEHRELLAIEEYEEVEP